MPIRIQCFDDQKFKKKKITSDKKNEIFFWPKIAIYLSQASLKDFQLQEKPSALRREYPALQNLKFPNFIFFVGLF